MLGNGGNEQTLHFHHFIGVIWLFILAMENLLYSHAFGIGQHVKHWSKINLHAGTLPDQKYWADSSSNELLNILP